MKTLMAVRMDDELLERARYIADHQKTTLTQLITDALLSRVQEREEAINKRYYSPRAHPHLQTKRVPLTIKEKKRIKERFGYTCQRCGITEAGWRAKHPPGEDPTNLRLRSLHVAHIVPIAMHKDAEKANREDNLTVLCPKCHEADHGAQHTWMDFRAQI